MLILAFFALFSGYVFWEIFVGYGNLLPTNVVSYFNYSFMLEFISQKRKFVPLLACLLAFSLFYLIIFFYRYHFTLLLLKAGFYAYCVVRLQNFFNKKWYFDYFYYFVVKYLSHISFKILFKNFDKGLFEKIFVKQLIWRIVDFGNIVRFKQTGQLTNYLMTITSLFIFFFVLLLLLDLSALNLVVLFLFYGLFIV